MRTALMMVLLLGAAVYAADPTDAELKEKALKLNAEATNEASFTTLLREMAKDKVNTPRLVKIAAKMQQEAKEKEGVFRFYPALVLAAAAQNCKEYDAAESFYQFAFKNAVKDLKVGKLQVLSGNLLINYYLARKQYDKAIKACEEFLKLEADEPQQVALGIMELKLRATVRNGEADRALEEVGDMLKPRRLNPLLRYELMRIKANLLRESGKFAESIAVYKEVLEKAAKDDAINERAKKFIESSFRYAMSGVYMEMDKLPEAVAELEKLIATNPENAVYKNDLGFIWSDRNLNLEKSEKLIREAIELDLANRKKAVEKGELDPDVGKKANAAYIDSLGWVLYKQQKYEEALKLLLESAGSGEEESDHIEIWDHVGDCYLAMGKKAEALESFLKGLKSEDVTAKDAERRRKVTEKANKLKRELKP